jgi:hypothetical protein
MNLRYVERISALEGSSTKGLFASIVADIPFGAEVVERQLGMQANMLLENLAARSVAYATDPRRIVVTSSTDDLFEARVVAEPDGSALVIISHQVAALSGYFATLGTFAASRSPGASRHVAARIEHDEASDYCVAALRATLICLVVDGLSGKASPTDPTAAISDSRARMVLDIQTFVLAHGSPMRCSVIRRSSGPPHTSWRPIASRWSRSRTSVWGVRTPVEWQHGWRWRRARSAKTESREAVLCAIQAWDSGSFRRTRCSDLGLVSEPGREELGLAGRIVVALT